MNSTKKYIQIIVATQTEWEITKDIISKFYSSKKSGGTDANKYMLEFDSCYVKILFLNSLGNVHSAIKTYHSNDLNNPLFVISAGICASNKGANRSYGDIIVGSEVIYYEPEKINPDDSEWRVEHYFSDFPESLKKEIKIYRNDFIDKQLPKDISGINSKIIQNGIYASGEKVINSKEMMDKISTKSINAISKDFTALDMETAGIAIACYKTNVNFIFMKAISDFGLEKKDNWQKYAAANSIFSAIKFCELLNQSDFDRAKINPLDREKINDKYEKVNEYIKLSSKLLVYNGLNGGVFTKDENTHEFVTDQDNQIEEYLIEKISALFGEKYKYYAEEKHKIKFDKNNPYWIIDSIDGTMNYKDGRAEYCISVAEYSNEEIMFGTIYMPIRELLISFNQNGLHVNGVLWKEIRKKPKNINDMVISVPGDLKKLEKTNSLSYIKKIIDYFGILRVTGSLAYDLASIALGEIDARISLSAKPEDVAAGIGLILKAGGRVTDINGDEWNINSTTIIAARNNYIHGEIIKAIKETK